MSNNNSFFPPTGNNNNNNNNNNNKKRKNRTYLPSGDDTSGQNKRRNASQRVNTPMMASPAQPGFGFGNPQLANPAIYGPHNPTPFPMGSASLMPQYPQFQAQFQPQAQYLHQPPQHVPQPGAYQPMSSFPSMGFAAGQQQTTPQVSVVARRHESSVQSGKNKIELIEADDVEAHGEGLIPTQLTVKGRPGKDNFVGQTKDPNVTVSTSTGPRAREVIDSQLAWHQNMYGEDNQIITAMKTVPILATGLRAHNRNIEFSDSTENLISTKTGGRRQQPGRPQNQAQLPAPAQAQAQPQGQPTLPCANCHKEGHLIGDCVGPPNHVHGDLPACPVCNSWGGGRRRGTPGNQGHKFDDCRMVQAVFHRLQKGMNQRLTYEDLANITDDELLMFFNGLVKRRVRKTPIRTKLVCWVDVLRETVRRHPTSAPIHDLRGRHPWPKSFAIEQLNPANVLAKPWDFYDYAAGNIESLPAGPVEQIIITFPDFVANGFPGVPPQVFSSGDRQQRNGKMEVDDSAEANNAQPQGLQVVPEQQPAQQPRQQQQQVPQQFPPVQQAQQQVPLQFPPVQQAQQQVPLQFPPVQRAQQQVPLQFPPVQQPQQQQQQPPRAAPVPQVQQPPQTGVVASSSRGPPPHGSLGNAGLGGSMFHHGSSASTATSSSMPSSLPAMSGQPSAQSPAPTPSRGSLPGKAPDSSKAKVNQAGARTSSKGPGQTAQTNLSGMAKQAFTGAQQSSKGQGQTDLAGMATQAFKGAQQSSKDQGQTKLAGRPKQTKPVAPPSKKGPPKPPATAPGASQTDLVVAPAAPLPPSTAAASVDTQTQQIAAGTALPPPDKDEELIDWDDEEEVK